MEIPGSTIDQMRARLENALHPEHILIEDDSIRHKRHPGARGHGGHYRLLIVSDRFKGQNSVARHRCIYEALNDMMHTSVHALAIRALTAEEAQSQLTRKES